jgi:hypothetical protein
VITLPLRFFCSPHAVQGRAIHMGRPLTSKRTSTASAWRVAMATMVAFQVQCRSSPVQRSATWKSSYMQSSVTGQVREGKASSCVCAWPRSTERLYQVKALRIPNPARGAVTSRAVSLRHCRGICGYCETSNWSYFNLSGNAIAIMAMSALA